MPVELAYKTYEVKNDKPDKSPLVIHHSLLGSKKNWKKVQSPWTICDIIT